MPIPGIMNPDLPLLSMPNPNFDLSQSAIDNNPRLTSSSDLGGTPSTRPVTLPEITPLELEDCTPEPQRTLGFGREFVTAFVAIFLAEMGDKTQFSTLLMAAESHSPWVVFAGAAAALMASSLIGVLLGRWLAAHLSPKKLKFATGVSLLLIAGSLVWDLVDFPVLP